MTGSQAVDRALTLLKCFTKEQGPWTLRDLAKETGLPKPTAYRLLHTLVKGGFLVHDSVHKAYTVGPELLSFTRQTLTQMDAQRLLSIAYLPMTKIHQLTGETVCLYRRVGSNRVLLAEFESPQQMRIVLGYGRVRRLYQGSVGKVFLMRASDEELAAEAITARGEGVKDDLASLTRQVEQVRRDGYCISRGTSVPGAATVSAPIFSGSGVVEGALLVTGPAIRWHEEKYLETAKLVAEGARAISDAWSPKGEVAASKSA